MYANRLVESSKVERMESIIGVGISVKSRGKPDVVSGIEMDRDGGKLSEAACVDVEETVEVS